jgi:DNA mismatch repair protein MutS2
VTVEARGLAIEVDASGIQEPDEAAERPPHPAPEGRTVVPNLPAVEPEIHLRGMRVEEASRRLETYLNEACLAGLGSVRIVHGFGTGALAQMVREMLAEYPLIESFRPGKRGEGGGGVTVAVLK